MDTAETPSQRLDRVEAQLPQPPAQPFDLEKAFEDAAQSLEAQKIHAAAQASTDTTIPAVRLLQASGAGILKSGFETKDFLFGQPSEADKWDFRKYVEAKSDTLRDRSAVYGVTESVSQFLVGMVGANKILGTVAKVAPEVAGASGAIKSSSKAASAAAESVKAAAVGSVVFDPHEERLSNLIESVPELSNPITRYVRAQPGDTDAEGRLKSAIESIGLDAVLGGALFLGAKAYRALKQGDAKGAAEAVKELEVVQKAETPAPTVQGPGGGGGGIAPTPEAANANVPLHTSTNDNFGAGSTINPDPSANPLSSAERVPVAGNPDTTMGSVPQAGNVNDPMRPAGQQDNFAGGVTPPQPAISEPPKTVGEFFDLGTKPKTMAESTGAPKAESISGTVEAPTVEAVQSKTSGMKGVGAAKAPDLIVPHAEDTKLILDNIAADAAALKQFGSREAAEEAGYTFSQANIPWQKLNAPEEVQAFIGNMADALKPELDKIKGGDVMSDVAVQARVNRLANAYGQDPEAIIGNLTAAGADAAKMVSQMEAADAIATKMAQEAYQVARKIQLGNLAEWGGDSIAAMGEFTKRVGVAMSTFGAARSMLSNSARTLRRARGDLERLSFEEISKIRSLDPTDLLNLFAKTDGDVNAMKAALTRPTFMQNLGNLAGHLLVNGLVSGMRTFEVNIIGNALMWVSRPIEKGIGGGVQALGQFLGVGLPGGSEMVKRARYELNATVGEIFGTLFHLLDSDTGQATWKSLKAYESIIDPHMVEASRIGAASRPEFRPIESPADLLHNAYAGFWHTTGAPTRVMGAADELSKQIRYRAYVSAEAQLEIERLGLVGKEAEEFHRNAISNAFDTEGRAVNVKALNEARVSTFQQELLRKGDADSAFGLPSAGSLVQDLTSNMPLARGVVPFVKTPSNLLRMGVRYTPGLQFLQKQFVRDISGGKGAEAQAQAIGQMVVGGLISSAVAVMAMRGEITGSGPKDPKARAELRATGWQPLSKVSRNPDGSLSYFPLSYFDPLATMIGVVADTVEIFKYPQKYEEHHIRLPTAIAMAVANNLGDKTYLRSLKQFFDFAADPIQNGGKFLGNLAGELVPVPIGGGVRKDFGPDPYTHDVRSLVDGIMANTWGLSATLPPKRDAFGQPIIVNRGFWSSTKDNLVDNEVIRLGIEAGIGLGAAPANHKGVDLRDVTLEDGRNAYDAFQELSARPSGKGPSLKDAAAKLIASKAYQRMADGDGTTAGTKGAALRDLVGDYRTAALKVLQQQSPALRNALSEAQRKAAAAYAAGGSNAKATGDSVRLQGLLSSFGLAPNLNGQ